MSIACETITTKDEWNRAIQVFPKAHFLQTWEWGDFKAQTTGWSAERCIFKDQQGIPIAAVSLLSRKIGPFRVMYAPKGPLFAVDESPYFGAILEYLETLARKRFAIWLKIDPDMVEAYGLPKTALVEDNDRPNRPNPIGQHALQILKARKWRFSSDQVQFRNTFYHDLTQSEDDLISAMNQSTRRKIRQAEKKGVTIRATTSENDLHTLYDIYAVTGDRQDFTIRPWDYYHQLWTTFLDAGMGQVFVAEVDGKIVSGVILFHFGKRVWYFNGMSANDYRDYQPNHALQWHVIRWAKSAGYQIFDWWGAPNEFNENDGMWGVYRFKDGFGGDLVRHIGAYDYVPFAPLYFAYSTLMPRIIALLRKRRSQETAAARHD